MIIRFRPLLIPSLWLVPGLALLVSLGFWQIQRLHEKEALIARVQGGLNAPALDLSQLLKSVTAESEYRHVRVVGRFLHNKEQYLFAQGPGGAPGVHVITPLVQTDGETVLVDRGFVPDSLRDPARRKSGQTSGQVTITGVLRLPQHPGLFTPAPNRGTHLWFAKDVAAMASAVGISAAPVLIEEDASQNPGGWPLGGQTRIDFPNDHLQYAITWFGLSLALFGVYLVYHHSRGRLTFGDALRRESLEHGIRQHQGR
jgi:surfeit locus 1 family protein